MITTARRTRFDRAPSRSKIVWVPIISVMAASALTAMPVIVTAPILPPLSFMLFIAWRLLQSGVWYPWAGAMFGLFDDLWSGRPVGSGMLLWSLVQLGIQMADRRMIWRDYGEDWVLAALALVFYLSAALVIDNMLGGHTRWVVIVPQIIVAILLQPMVTRLAGWLDQWRFG